ncbi:MAG TPA: cbb3-type cytochrome c oxidase subunit I [Nitrospira sp.]
MPHRDLTARLIALWERPHTLRGWFATVDHKEIGKRYLATAFTFLLIGGIEAILIRRQLSRPDSAVFTPEAYDQIFSMHGITMIFWYASPILSGFSNYLIPLMGGMRDMAYPRLNAFSVYGRVDGPSAFSHPLCANTWRNGKKLGDETRAPE